MGKGVGVGEGEGGMSVGLKGRGEGKGKERICEGWANISLTDEEERKCGKVIWGGGSWKLLFIYILYTITYMFLIA
jgi:hypothetical protein